MHQYPASQGRLIVDELRQALPDVVAVYRFGSSVEGTSHGGSDIDAAIQVVAWGRSG